MSRKPGLTSVQDESFVPCKFIRHAARILSNLAQQNTDGICGREESDRRTKVRLLHGAMFSQLSVFLVRGESCDSRQPAGDLRTPREHVIAVRLGLRVPSMVSSLRQLASAECTKIYVRMFTDPARRMSLTVTMVEKRTQQSDATSAMAAHCGRLIPRLCGSEG